jgi:pimeloyl-ACP methyl ester carboxylesterase
MVKDVVYLVKALGYDTVSLIVGHDFGAVVANLCALARPDMFKSLIMMSYPTKGAPEVPFATSPSYYQPPPPLSPPADIDKALSELPRPRKHYQGYYCSAAANSEMTYPTGESLHTFLRGYFHLKSADWDANQPHTLQGWTASELQKMPCYYIMDLADNMRQAVAREMDQEDPERVAKRASRWLPDHELAVYVDEWARITFQGGLNWYRMETEPEIASDEAVYSGAKIEVPTMFVSGKSDWGPFQEPGALEAMEAEKSVGKGLYRGTVLIEGAGHWANQEQPERCVAEILKMARALDG